MDGAIIQVIDGELVYQDERSQRPVQPQLATQLMAIAQGLQQGLYSQQQYMQAYQAVLTAERSANEKALAAVVDVADGAKELAIAALSQQQELILAQQQTIQQMAQSQASSNGSSAPVSVTVEHWGWYGDPVAFWAFSMVFFVAILFMGVGIIAVQESNRPARSSAAQVQNWV